MILLSLGADTGKKVSNIMNQQNQTNYIKVIQETVRGVMKEARHLTMPSLKETIMKTIFIIMICAMMTGFLLIVGEIVVKLLALII